MASEGPEDFDEAYRKIIQTLAIHLAIALQVLSYECDKIRTILCAVHKPAGH
jgi:hypothetical protein